MVACVGYEEVVLQRLIVLLSTRQIAAFEVLGELVQSLRHRTTLRSGCTQWPELLEVRKVRLSGGDVSRLQVLAKLLEFVMELLSLGLYVLNVVEEAAG